MLISLKWTSLGSLGSELHNIEGCWDAVDFLIDLPWSVTLKPISFPHGFSMVFPVICSLEFIDQAAI